ncbi:hypothetical protein [Dyella sp. 2HG41-7]|uniref:hypothetical protein n=1 Tax=Dyella sp. 2HG41-7 TaxID=2883239 RepID=UPI001F3068C3|nr:hypothetical protein [Dyella sp. 2HG41-7]
MWRTPSSLKWLINKRSRFSGALVKLEKTRDELVSKIQELENKASAIRSKLAALDETIRLHEIVIEPTDIRPVKPQSNTYLVPFGQLGRSILKVLREHDGWMTTNEIIRRISHLSEHFQVWDAEYVRRSVRCRLRQLATKGILERKVDASDRGRHDGVTQTLWRLSTVAANPWCYQTDSDLST